MMTISIGEKADKLNNLKQQKTALNKQIENLNKSIIPLEIDIANELESIGGTKFSTKQVAITMTKADVPNIENLEEFYKYMVEHNAPYLLQRRPSVAAIQEIWNSGQKIDGVNKVNKVTIRTKTL